MKREHIIALMGAMVDRPGAANMLLKRLRTLLHFGMDLGWIKEDPTARVKSYRSKELHTWTEEEIATFEAQWPEGSKQRLAFALLVYTGQRGSDVRKMVWTDMVGTTIRVAQQKTGTKLVLPLHPDLQVLLATAPRKQATILSLSTVPLSHQKASVISYQAQFEAQVSLHSAKRMVCVKLLHAALLTLDARRSK
jgi:integrase